MLNILLLLLLYLFSPSLCQNSNEEDRLSAAFAYLAYPSVFDGLIIENLEIPFQFRALIYLNLVTFNAWSNFHPTAVDIFGRNRFKLPPSFHTTPNKNTAILYGLLRVYEASPQSFGGPSGLSSLRKIFVDKGLDPDDRSVNVSTVIGVGNREGIDTAKLMAIDNWNQDGSKTSSQSLYALPFQDYTDYTPVNTPWNIKYPFRWQPLLETNNLGFFFRQEHITPYAGSSFAFSISPKEMAKRTVASPYENPNAIVGKNVLARDLSTLKKLARGVFKTSRDIGERERLLAELFDNKVNGFRTKENPLGVASIAAAVRFFMLGTQLDFSLDDDIIFGLAANIASFDSLALVWKEKRRHDAIRPTGQTMEFLFGKKKVKVGGTSYGPNVDIEPGEWQPYIRTMPHSEFPSGSACSCLAVIEQALTWTNGRDYFPYNITIPKGSSKFGGPNFPREDVVIPINKLSDWSKLCSTSRLWAGVHFKGAETAGEQLCEGIGRDSQILTNNLVAGKADTTWMQWLNEDVEKFWEASR